jgi:nucleoside-diphosphate-sugar epimerase
MKRNCVLFVGCGDLGIRSGKILLDKGWLVTGVRRNPAQLPPGFAGIAADYTTAGSLDFLRESRPDYVVTSFNPSDRSVEGYRRGFTQAAQNLLAGLGAHRPAGILMVSSTRVFAERAGGWVDEDSPLASDDPRALAIIEAEQLLRQSPHPVCVLRCAGIYGAPDGRLLNKVRRGEWGAGQAPRYGNRIHRDDCAGFMAYLLEAMAAGRSLAPVYIGVDDLPAPQAEVERWLAQRLGLPRNPDWSPAQATDAFQIGHKRCSNRLLHASGYRLLHPDYRSGYAAALAAA